MVIWLLFAVLTAVIIFIVTGPLSGQSTPADTAVESANIAVYKDQLAELDADLERGVIGAAEAQAARVEISRKILNVADQAGGGTAAGGATVNAEGGVEATAETSQPASQSSSQRSGRTASQPTRQNLALSLSVLIPVVAGLTYAALGAPQLPNLPHAPRLKENLQTASAQNLLARVEARLRTHPEEGKGWDVIAPFYFQTRRFGDAADAYRNAIRLLGETPHRMIGYVKSAIAANNGIVTEDLRKISERLTVLVPERAEPKFWIGLALEQDGNLAGAQKAYSDLLAMATDKDPWRPMVQGRLDGLAKKKTQ